MHQLIADVIPLGVDPRDGSRREVKGAKKPRGFAAMSPERRRELGQSGGKKSQQLHPHTWTPEQAAEAAYKGAARVTENGTRYKFDSAKAREAAVLGVAARRQRKIRNLTIEQE